MKDQISFLSEIGSMISEALWSEPELAKKQQILEQVSEKISNRITSLLPPGSVLMG